MGAFLEFQVGYYQGIILFQTLGCPDVVMCRIP
jgi:hypothetical protein